jgi:hypothetical protein
LSAVAANNTPSFKDAETNASSDGDDFHKELMLLCTRDGTPELARNTVYTLAQLLRKESGDTKGFEPLLKVLTSCQTCECPVGAGCGHCLKGRKKTTRQLSLRRNVS